LGLTRRPPLLLGVAAAALGVALTTALLYALRDVAPVVSLGVVYLVVVLAVASVWGVWLGLATALASALAFNFFHIPPTGQLAIRGGENWVALIVFFAAAALASSLTELARRRTVEAEQRRQEADLNAEMARLLLRGGRLEETLPAVGERLARAFDAPSASIVARAVDGTFPLREGPRQIGTLTVDAPEPVLRRIQTRIVPALESLLAAALERDALMADAVETAALRRSDVIKTALLRSVSHDLRSPLTAILTSAEALRLAPDERVALADDITTEATRLSRLIDNLLDLSRLEAGAAETRPEWSSIEEVLTAAAEQVPDGQFKLALDDDLPPVRADAAQLERAFANLLENAARHSGDEPVSVRARASGGRLLVRVVDHGPGIPRAEQERIFEPFVRGGDAASGSGLGLAIVRGFVEANGGNVHVESLPGQGASFVVALPLPEAVPA